MTILPRRGGNLDEPALSADVVALLEHIARLQKLWLHALGHLHARALEGGRQPPLEELPERLLGFPDVDYSDVAVNRSLDMEDLARRRTILQAQLAQDAVGLLLGHR